MINKVLYVLGGEVASGAEIVCERLIANSSIDSHLFIAPGDFSYSLLKSEKPYRINIIDRLKRLNRNNSSPFTFYLRALSNYLAIPALVFKYIKKNNIDVVHCNTIGQASYLLPLVALSPVLCSRVKWVWTDHDLKYYFPPDSFLSVLCSKFYDITFVVSEAVKKKYTPNKKIIVLYNGLNCDTFKPDVLLRESYRSRLRLDDRSVVIGNAGVMSLRKGQYALIQAFNILRRSDNDLYLLLAGRFGDDEFSYNELVKTVIDSPGVIYVGHINNMADFYNGCDIVVSNSDILGSEPLGTTIYEAMACEKIVLGSDTGGTKEIIDDSVDGYLFEADNVDALVSKLGEVVDSFDDLDKIRKAARKKVLQKFNLDNMASDYRKHLTAK